MIDKKNIETNLNQKNSKRWMENKINKKTFVMEKYVTLLPKDLATLT